ncbi:hypothetical protein CAC42_3746 [Sphaceloma murrayae]|uniref:Cyclase n=1 Tax=Sphaceloma murrayae TaxID=2082308 RepID=A0A2K1QHT0_9PEZI|nr:hypothetical protein CAC42_3746 [Sphaceloma murrayae]
MAPTWNADDTSFPSRKDLPSIDNAPKDAAWFWGAEDSLGRLNLLTPRRVAASAKLIESGEIVPVNLPLTTPEVPGFGREVFQHTIKELAPGMAYDDLYTLNTQSGTQWDGFRHFAHLASKTFYNGTKEADIVGEKKNHKCSMHHWAEHGIAGRGVLLDFTAWAEKNGRKYDAYGHDEITYEELKKVGEAQGIDIRPKSQGGDIEIGDLLFVRSGWVKAYHALPKEERNELALRHSELGEGNKATFSGVCQEEAVLDWLHDCYFSAVGGDAPAFEAWPSTKGFFLHEYILAMWGMPLGEMLDLEGLAKACEKHKRWFFFFSSCPNNMPGGVSSHVNGQAIF